MTNGDGFKNNNKKVFCLIVTRPFTRRSVRDLQALLMGRTARHNYCLNFSEIGKQVVKWRRSEI
jgi:hypothetical protein